MNYEICSGYHCIFSCYEARYAAGGVFTRVSPRFVTVPPVVAEIQYGIKRLDNDSKKCFLLKAERDRLLSVITVVPWRPESSKKYGEIKADLEHRGKLIDDFDIAIAAIAMSHKCGVLTNNLKHFQRIKGLESKGWQ